MDPFGCFSTDFNEIFRISFFRSGGLNGAVRSDLTPLQFLKLVKLVKNNQMDPSFVYQGVDDILIQHKNKIGTTYIFVQLTK